MKIKSEKIKLTLISIGSIIAISSPVIIIGSIFAYNQSRTSPEQNLLNNFFNQNEQIIFRKDVFTISQPTEDQQGNFVVQNVKKNNIIFGESKKLNNNAYDIEILSIIPDVSNGTLRFTYKVFSLLNPLIKITKTSEVYSQFLNQNSKLEDFFKVL
ncbi:MAG: hypothetical protein KFW07_00580 [Mycoplasmataceae bacterium]|nr:hypothetical protein [Mycoplasmataceae bacterium]